MGIKLARLGLSNLKVGTATSLGERLAELIASHDTSPAEELDVVFATLTDFTDHEMLADDQILLSSTDSPQRIELACGEMAPNVALSPSRHERS